jgi:hypothetical protein
MDVDTLVEGRGTDLEEFDDQGEALKLVFKLMLQKAETDDEVVRVEELREKEEQFFTPLLLVVCHQWLLAQDTKLKKQKVEERWKDKEEEEKKKSRLYASQIEACVDEGYKRMLDNAESDYDYRFAFRVGHMMRCGYNPIHAVDDIEEERMEIMRRLGMPFEEKKTIREGKGAEEYPSFVQRNIKKAVDTLMTVEYKAPATWINEQMKIVDALVTAHRQSVVVNNTLEVKMDEIEKLKRKVEDQQHRIASLKFKRDFYKSKAALPHPLSGAAGAGGQEEEVSDSDSDSEQDEDERKPVAASSSSSSGSGPSGEGGGGGKRKMVRMTLPNGDIDVDKRGRFSAYAAAAIDLGVDPRDVASIDDQVWPDLVNIRAGKGKEKGKV